MKLVERSAKAKEGVPVYVSVMASAGSSTEYVYVRRPTVGTDFCPACLRRVSGRGWHGRKGGMHSLRFAANLPASPPVVIDLAFCQEGLLWHFSSMSMKSAATGGDSFL